VIRRLGLLTWCALLVGYAFVALAVAQATQKFPSKGTVKIGSGPLPLLVHYIDASGKTVELSLRDFQFEPPPISKSKELAAIASTPCSRGDFVNVASKLEGKARGTDAAGIGRFVWLVRGKYVTDGTKWWFDGTAASADDTYDFNKEKDGARAFWAEVSTRIGAAFPGKSFKVHITGSLPIRIDGPCESNIAGQVLV